MYPKALLIVLIAGLFTSLSVTAADAPLPDLRQGCRSIVALASTGADSVNQMDETYCFGYMGAVVDFLSFTRASGGELYNICLPEGIALGQATRVFVDYMDDHPENLHYPDLGLVLFALKTSFPCSGVAE